VGQLASDLVDLLGPSDAIAFSHAELDITDPVAVDRVFAEVEPDVVFNCAAFHNVDVCEREPDAAWATNVRAVRDLAGPRAPSSCTCPRTTCSTAGARSPTGRTTSPPRGRCTR
jgi:dTDP-4-dehydrorhamnose reductase